MTQEHQIYDVMVIGSGFAGMAAALFASNRGLSVVQAGSTGGIDFSTGFIDLMGVHPIEEGRRWKNPWKAIEAVVHDRPDHPYALLSDAEIRNGIGEFTDFLTEMGLDYVGYDDRNICALTPAGTVKRTYRVPGSAWKGTEALTKRSATLIVDFHGLKGFSGTQLVESHIHAWPALRTVRLDFPGSRGELYPEHMAWALADPVNRVKLAESVIPHIHSAEYIGFPAVLGLNDPRMVIRHLEDMTGKQIFEIPTLPPSIAGPRLRAVFDRSLPHRGVRTLSQKMVEKVQVREDGTFLLEAGKGAAIVTVAAKNVILATGRFFGKGLKAQRHNVIEAVFGVPVIQPENRNNWHGDTFFTAKGHPLNMAGVEVDIHLRPLSGGRVLYKNLYAAGTILAHHDWMRMKCGAGLAISTAYKAVQELQL